MRTLVSYFLGRSNIAAANAFPDTVALDQMSEIKQSVRFAIPINIILGVVNLVVAIEAGLFVAGLVWFTFSLVVNLIRLWVCTLPAPERVSQASGHGRLTSLTTQRYLIWASALISGLVWAAVPVLCAGYTAPQTLFYLTVVCGVTAGAVTHGTPDARTPMSFILPTLTSVAVCMFAAGGFQRICIAVTVIIYTAALIRSSIRAEYAFKALSRAKNEATVAAADLAVTNARSTEMIEIMHHRATHDHLTGLLNRSGFLAEVEDCLPEPGGSYCLIFVDLDGFKAVNDVYGHRKGDYVLTEVATRLQGLMIGGARLARMGGDEFAIFFPLPAICAPRELAEAVISAVGIPIEGVDIASLGASVGVHIDASGDIADMLACADEALYAAKRGGRNRYHVFDQALRDQLQKRRDLERDLLKHLDEGRLEVWFQPIYAIGRALPDSLEALLRWNHPQHGWISPEDLVRLAALNGYSEQLLRFVLERVCQLLGKMVAEGISDVKVAMNVSPREMAQLPVDLIILRRFEALGLPPHLLDVEITEETALDIAAVQEKIKTLSQAKVTISLDDFGTGYSSLDSVRHRRVDRIKIDRGFVTNITRSTHDQYLVGAMINLGRMLNIEVVVEGIETQADFDTIHMLGGRLMQGYFLHRPAPEAATLAALRVHSQASEDLVMSPKILSHR